MALTSNDLFYRDGYQIALAKAQALSRVADKSADENEFGIASSLKILSAEETIKAVALLTIHFKIEGEVTGLEKIFKDHKTKHEILAESSVKNFSQELIEKLISTNMIYRRIPIFLLSIIYSAMLYRGLKVSNRQ